ncbi:uncharacterized protein EI90DRAFT_3113366 [Cantharellus anzutake]|uniref:uncharacterized protein n=1 Tax=Cantharellus anzutake TaxID=1750568 RepID=UPI0019060F33|nr:uncharacterized protein EI90DRAFT_3113366 [Cantharellus anzutake]KAF8306136.1 hypothetical protein EI90DRAFT_3113366 [Cantharellus anzutake]
MDKPTEPDFSGKKHRDSSAVSMAPSLEGSVDLAAARRARVKMILLKCCKAGLLKDLKMSPSQFSIVLSISLMFSNFLFKRIGARIFIPTLVVAWGLVETFQGLKMKPRESILTAHVYFHSISGPLIPALILYLSEFYPPRVAEKDSHVLKCYEPWGAFSGLLAYAIVHLDGKGGKPSWRKVSLLVFGVASYFWLPRILSATLMTEEEKFAYTRTIQEDTVFTVDDIFQLSSVWSTLTAPHVLFLSTAGFIIGVDPPAVVGSLGYSPAKTQLYGVPPFACGFIWEIAIGSSFITLAGFIMMYRLAQMSCEVWLVFAQVIGLSSPSLCGYVQFYPHYRRAQLSHLVISTSAALLVRTNLANNDSLITYAAFIVDVCLALGYFHYKNLRKAEERRLHGNGADDDIEEKLRLGDRHRDFIYTL